MKIVADQVAPWLAGRLTSLGTDGFGRSDNRQHLRRHFEVNAESIAASALAAWRGPGSSTLPWRSRPWRSWASIRTRETLLAPDRSRMASELSADQMIPPSFPCTPPWR